MVEGRGADGAAPVWIAPVKKEKVIFNAAILKRVQRAEWTCDHAWLRARSVCDPREVSCGAFIDALYARDDQVMCFTSMRSVGDFMRWRGGWFELGKQPGIKARRVKAYSGRSHDRMVTADGACAPGGARLPVRATVKAVPAAACGKTTFTLLYI
jgi:hypothetical protein